MASTKWLINTFMVFAIVMSFLSVLGLCQGKSWASPASICQDSSNITSGSNVGSSSFCQDQVGTPSNPIFTTLNLVIDIISSIAGFVAVVMIVVSGLQMVSSSGNSEKISNARNTILYALIGLIVVVLSRILVLFILKKVT
jgi:hypothetical protein